VPPASSQHKGFAYVVLPRQAEVAPAQEALANAVVGSSQLQVRPQPALQEEPVKWPLHCPLQCGRGWGLGPLLVESLTAWLDLGGSGDHRNRPVSE
jgi:hypothetical protein